MRSVLGVRVLSPEAGDLSDRRNKHLDVRQKRGEAASFQMDEFNSTELDDADVVADM